MNAAGASAGETGTGIAGSKLPADGMAGMLAASAEAGGSESWPDVPG